MGVVLHIYFCNLHGLMVKCCTERPEGPVFHPRPGYRDCTLGQSMLYMCPYEQDVPMGANTIWEGGPTKK